jgi:uncharacterized repeat protein (TIGR03803 family)
MLKKLYLPVFLWLLSFMAPQSMLAQRFYGVAYNGGTNHNGTFFEWNATTGTYVKEIDFNSSIGAYPVSSPVAFQGNLYGVTNMGGAYGMGVIFEWNPTSRTYTKKADFDGINGGHPIHCFTLHDGRFYGITTTGGASDVGVIYEWSPATNIFTKKIELEMDNGYTPSGNLRYHNGKFYGMMAGGGFFGYGVVFEWDPVTNVYTRKVDFDGTNGAYPYGQLVLYNGKLYGTTSKGGANDGGVIFEWDPASNLCVKKVDFSEADGNYPYSHLVEFNNKFYGLTAAGGTYSGGVLFEWDPSTNIYARKVDLSYFFGAFPQFNNLTVASGKLYGMTYGGGANGNGAIFEWDPVSNEYTKRRDFDPLSTGGSNPIASLTAYQPITTLPVTLHSFSAQPLNNKVLLLWKSHADDAAVFEVERSERDNHFVSIGQVTSKGVNHTAYEFTDGSYSTVRSNYVHYRLKAKEANGDCSYSKTIVVATNISISCYPNPASHELHVGINAPVTETIYWKITDYSGKLMKRGKYSLSRGSNTISLKIDDLPSNHYLLSVNGKAVQQQVTFLKKD